MLRAQVLVVDDRESVVSNVVQLLGETHEITVVGEPAAAMSLIGRRHFDVVLTAARPSGTSALDLLSAIRSRCCGGDTSFVVMTGVSRGEDDGTATRLEAEEIARLVARSVERAGPPGNDADDACIDTDFREALTAARDRASRQYLVSVMRRFCGNVTRAATQAGMTRENMHRLLRKYEIASESFKRTSSR